MLSVNKNWRKRGVGEHDPPLLPPSLRRLTAVPTTPPHVMPSPASTLVRRTIDVMKRNGVTEVRVQTWRHVPPQISYPGRPRNRV